MNVDSKPPEDPGGSGPDALESLVERCRPDLEEFLRRRAGRRLRGQESVSDLAQSVCREILTHRDRFQFPGEENFRRWLFATALRKLGRRHEYYGAIKREIGRNVPLPDSDALLRAITTPSQAAMAGELRERVAAAFRELSAEQRLVIHLARVEGLPRPEIAARLGKSPGAVRTLLCRALAALAEQVGDLDDSGPEGR